MTKENTRTPLLLTLCEEISLEIQPHLWHVKILLHMHVASCVMFCFGAVCVHFQ